MAEDWYRTLFRGNGLELRDYRCGRQDCGLTEEYEAPFDSVVIPRAGVFMKHVRGTTVVADTSRAVIFRRGETFRLSHPAGPGDRVSELALPPGLLDELSPAGRPGTAPPTGAEIGPRAYLLHRLALSNVRDGSVVDALAVEETILHLAATVARTATGAGRRARRRRRMRPDTDRAHRRLLEDTRLLLASGFAEPWTLASIAAAVSSSPFHLARVFAAREGRSIHRHLNRLRLRAALESLVETEAGLRRLARDVGYSSHSHFTRAFRAEFGLTPSAVRAAATRGDLRRIRTCLADEGPAPGG